MPEQFFKMASGRKQRREQQKSKVNNSFFAVLLSLPQGSQRDQEEIKNFPL